jgi:hypothetical protein
VFAALVAFDVVFAVAAPAFSLPRDFIPFVGVGLRTDEELRLIYAFNAAIGNYLDAFKFTLTEGHVFTQLGEVPFLCLAFQGWL